MIEKKCFQNILTILKNQKTDKRARSEMKLVVPLEVRDPRSFRDSGFFCETHKKEKKKKLENKLFSIFNKRVKTSTVSFSLRKADADGCYISQALRNVL